MRQSPWGVFRRGLFTARDPFGFASDNIRHDPSAWWIAAAGLRGPCIAQGAAGCGAAAGQSRPAAQGAAIAAIEADDGGRGRRSIALTVLSRVDYCLDQGDAVVDLFERCGEVETYLGEGVR